MCQALLMVAHNFTDQWALSIAVKKKKRGWICNGAKLNIPLPLFSKDTAFWIPLCCQVPPLKYRISHCVVSLTTCLIFHLNWNFASPHFWDTWCAAHPGWITIQAKGQTLRASKWGSVCVSGFVVTWLIIALFGDIQFIGIQSTVHTENEECGVKGIVIPFLIKLQPGDDELSLA